MQCSRYRILIHKHLEGRASEQEVEALRAHLDVCPSCRRCQEETRALMEMLRVSSIPVPANLSVSVTRRLQSQQLPGPSPRRSLTTGLILGSSFVAAGCLVLLFSFLGVDFLSLPANIHEHLTLLFSSLSMSFDTLFNSLSNLRALFPSL